MLEALQFADTVQEYHLADDRLKSSLPGVITAAFSILPHLLSAQIMTQNTLLAQCYTLLHDYCDEEGFSDPPPPASQIISSWDSDFKPVKQQIETGLACIASGKTVQKPMQPDSRKGVSITNGASTQRRPSGNPLRSQTFPAIAAPPGPPSPEANPKPRISAIPSQTSLSLATPNYGSSTITSPSPGDVAVHHAPAGPRADYFNRDRLPSNSSLPSIAAAKKKPPPPPPPPKRQPSTQDLWVTALYDFAGQGQGDLAFREGDRIRVVKKTDSTDDWWEGDLRGVQGSFPANYCQKV